MGGGVGLSLFFFPFLCLGVEETTQTGGEQFAFFCL